MLRPLPLIVLLSFASLIHAADQPDPPSTDKLAIQIEKLIAQLGDDEYARRERAQEELLAIGLPAFDPLMLAQESDDVEIGFRARNLVRRIRIAWVNESDNLQVRNILKGYDGQAVGERLTRLNSLAKLEENAGVTALCRVARFETSSYLSKSAALLVMQNIAPETETEKQATAKLLLDQTGTSRQIGSQWIRTFANTLIDPDSTLQAWEKHVNTEWTLFEEYPTQTNPNLVRDFLRWRAKELGELGRRDESIAVMRRTIDLLDSTPDQILDTVDWLMEREAFSVVEDVAKRFPTRFADNQTLQYRLAESYLLGGNEKLANETADKALHIFAATASSEHYLQGVNLQERGLYDWAEKEYRFVFEGVPVGSLNDLRTRLLLSEMLHDLQKEEKAADVLHTAIAAMEKDPDIRSVIEDSLRRDVGGIKSRMRFFYGLAAIQADNTAKAKEHYLKGLEADPSDADLLIGMHRLPKADEEWKKKTKEAIESAAKNFLTEKKELEEDIDQSPNESQRQYTRYQLAIVANQYAWLVSNTIGDYQQALKASQLSLEIRVDSPGYLDTLGRCYYAVGDLENAIKSQSKAAELDPHSLAIQRQLAFFKAEKEKRKK